MRFVDTNILLYAISKSAEEQNKSRIALEILHARDLALSVQVLQEFYVQATRATKSDRIGHEEAAALIETYQRYRVQDVTVPLMNAALVCSRRYQLSYWDAAIIEAARASACAVLLTEDLQNGQDYGGVRVQNPFAP